MKKVIIKRLLSTVLTVIVVVGFIGCNEQENVSTEDIASSGKSVIVLDSIPDGYYVGYYYLDDNTTIEIKEYLKDGKLYKRWINGEEQDIQYAPVEAGRFYKKGDNKYAQNRAIDLALQLSDKYPCVSILAESSIEDSDMMVYSVYYETSRPCEYDKYKK